MKRTILDPRNVIKKIVFLILMITFAFIPFHSNAKANESIQAYIDVSHFNESNFYTSLDGEWFYLAEKLVDPSEIYHYIWSGTLATTMLPNSFENQIGRINTYATYAVRVKVPNYYIGKTVAIYIPFQYTAYKLYADGTEIASNGTVGRNAEAHRSSMSPRIGYTVPFTNEILLTLQISNFEYKRGGFENPIYIGDATIVSQKFNTNIIWMLFVNGCIFIMGIFMILFAWFRRQEKSFFLFGVFCISFALRAFFSDPFFYTLTPLPFNFVWGTRLEYILTNLSIVMVILLVCEWYLSGKTGRLFKRATIPFIVLMVATLFLQPLIFEQFFSYIVILTIFLLVYFSYDFIRRYKNVTYKDIPNLFGIVIVALALFNDYLLSLGWINSNKLSLIAVGIFVVIQVFTISKSYADKVVETEQLNLTLTSLNATLDEQVHVRTKELQVANDLLAYQANIDGLTGVYNRHRFNTYIKEAFQLAVKYNEPLSIILIDVDEFKKYNDQYGHIQGDSLLKTVVQLMSEQLPADSLFARYGGEEFIVVMPEILEDKAYYYAEVMRKAVDDAKLVHERRDYGYATISLGVATYNQSFQFATEIDLVDAADQALYMSKDNGRNRTTIYSNSLVKISP